MRSLQWVVCVALLLSMPTTGVGQGPSEVYRKTVRGVVWIENFLPKEHGVAQGSGFLVDKDRRLVITNYHVAHGEEAMDVYFPAREGNGGLITDRNYYRENRKALEKLGYYTAGRVIASDSLKDLVVLRLSAVPETARELELADDDPSESAGLNMMGNPAGRELWRWSRGSLDEIARFQHSFSGRDLSVDFRAVHFFSDSYGGNSGGPILNDDGKVVGVEESSGGEGGMRATAVHYSEVRDILGSIEEYRVFSIDNRTHGPLNYSIHWGDGDWDESTLKPGHTMVHWSPKSATPRIRFDSSYADGFQAQEYALDYYTAYIGRGVTPSKKWDAREYNFQAVGNTIRLYSNE